MVSGPATDLEIRATLIEQHSPPEILVHGLVTPDDVDRLFEMFVYPYISTAFDTDEVVIDFTSVSTQVIVTLPWLITHIMS